MAKRFLAAALAAFTVLSFAACETAQPPYSESGDNTSEHYSESEEQSAASAPSIEVSEMEQPSEKNYPTVSGTFLQPYAFASYSDKQWENHLNGLLEVGIDLLIIQWTSTTPYAAFSDCYYPSEYAAEHKGSSFNDCSQMLERCLNAAEKTGVKVFVGLNISDEWWSNTILNKSWRDSQAEIGAISAREIYDLYKEKYPTALAGWYFAWELYNGMQGHEAEAGEFLNQYLEPLTEIDPTMPLMLSPFVTAGGGSPEKAGSEWTKVFETANFRDGDIFCCQDAVGAGWITIDLLEDYFRELKKAVDTESGLHFWANNENFTKDYNSAPVERFVQQMKLSQPYVENHVTFAYSHYYSKDQAGKSGYHETYKCYYETGTLPDCEIAAPTVKFTEKDDGRLLIDLTVLQSKIGFERVRILDADGNELKTTPITQNMRLREKLSLSYTVEKADTFVVEITDTVGNVALFSVSYN